MRTVKILTLSGSLCAGTVNNQLAGSVARQLALADINVSQASLADYPMPLCDSEAENDRGIPDQAHKLKNLIQAHDGVFIASPEVNAGVAPALKNAFDWISRISGASEAGGVVFHQNRVFAIGSATREKTGGALGLMNLRTILEMGLGAFVLPQMLSIGHAQTAFDAKGNLLADDADEQLRVLVRALIRQTRFERAL